MKQTILYDEAYEYSMSTDYQSLDLNFDYGTRYNRINMQFSHFHPYYEIYFLLHGDAEHFVEGNPYNLKTYDFVLLKPYRLHRTSYAEKNPCKRLIISFRMDYLQDYFPEAAEVLNALFLDDKPIYRFNETILSQIIDIINSIFKTSKKKLPTSNLMITSYFMELLHMFYENRDNNDYFVERASKDNLESKIYEITSYIHKNYSENITLDSLSKQFYISPHYLSRHFKTYTGFTMVQYLQETRVKRAQELLLDTDLKVIDIISACGFGSISQFNRVFNNLVKVSPSKYRQSNKL